MIMRIQISFFDDIGSLQIFLEEWKQFVLLTTDANNHFHESALSYAGLCVMLAEND